jgi:hypothetical protein
MVLKLFAILTTLCLLVLAAATTNVSQNNNRKLPQNPKTTKYAGGVWYHGANLLQNPDASSSTVSPPWTQSTGNWIVTSGPVVLGSQSIDTSDGSPWFLDSGGVSINLNCSSCSKSRTVELVQTVPFNGAFFQTNTGAIEYGGDAFAVGTGTGSGSSGIYHASEGYEASYRLDFLDSSGQTLATDTSGPVFNSAFGCVLGNLIKNRYGYRRAVGVNIPTATRSIRFTATITDRLSVCYNYSTTGTFRNGLDNLWLVLWVNGSPTASGAKQGPAPSPIVKVTLTPKRAPNRHPRQ